jgi:hypothetical protein
MTKTFVIGDIQLKNYYTNAQSTHKVAQSKSFILLHKILHITYLNIFIKYNSRFKSSFAKHF